MRIVLRLIDGYCLAGGIVAALALACLFLIGAAEILLRYAFATSLTFIVEYNGYLLGIVFLAGLGYVLGRGGHIRVKAATSALPPAALRAVEAACILLGLLISGYLSVALWRLTIGTWQIGTVSYFSSRTPVFLPQGAMALASLTLTLAFVARLLRFLTGQPLEQGGPPAAGSARVASELPE